MLSLMGSVMFFQLHSWLRQALLCVLCLGLACPALAAAGSNQRQIAFVLILTRHGVRAPGSLPERLHRYSVDPWPKWPVAPDDLTDHGYKVLVRFGAWDREWLADNGVLRSAGCDASDIYIYTDSDERTIRSGYALAEGLDPCCALAVHSLPQGAHDPLFHFKPSNLDAATRAHVIAAVRQRLPGGLRAFTASHQHQLDLLQVVLDGCKPGEACLKRTHPEIRLNNIRSRMNTERSHDVVSVRGPVFAAAGLAEDILLEYTEGLPENQVAWGRLNPSQLREIINLHTAEFSIRHRTPALARIQMSNLFDHIVLTLQQAVDGRAVKGAFGPVGKKLVIVDGHDTDIAAIAGLLHLHWTLDGRRDDIPPGTQLQFLVFRDGQGHASIQLRIAMQTLEQMRYARPLTQSAGPASAILNPPQCTMENQACSWTSFHQATTRAIDPRFVVPLK